MDDWFGLHLAGRQLKEPTGQVVELVDDDGLLFLGLDFDARWRADPTLARQVGLVRSFLEYPMVIGLVELSHCDPEAGRFVYPTGSVLTLKEIQRSHADLGHTIGIRAALELLYLAGQILTEAAANGAGQGCFSHTGLTPWRLTVRDDSHVQVIGHGIPQLDVLAWRHDPGTLPDPDSARYAPPERLSGHGEDEAADTAALVIIAYELITGQPLYPGHDPAELVRAASIAEAVPMLSRPNALPRDLAQVFARSLVFDPDSRLRGSAWLAEVATLLDTHSDGDGLEGVVARVRGTAVEGTRRARIRQTHDTAAFTPTALAAAAASSDGEPSVNRPARWQKVDRTAPARPTPAAEPGPARRRRRDGAPRPLALDDDGADLPLLDLDEPGPADFEPNDGEDSGYGRREDDRDEPDSEPVRPRLRRRLDTENVPRPLHAASRPAPAPSPVSPGSALSGSGSDDGPTTGVPGRRRRRNEPA